MERLGEAMKVICKSEWMRRTWSEPLFDGCSRRTKRKYHQQALCVPVCLSTDTSDWDTRTGTTSVPVALLL